jgi:chromosome segregation ATPase
MKMVRKLGILLLIAALSGAIYWNLRASRQLSEAERLRQSEEDRLARLESELDRQKRLSQSGIEDERRRVEELRSRFAAEKAALDSLEQRFSVARNRGLPGNESVQELQARLREAQDGLAEVDAQLKSVKSRQDELGKQGKLAQDQQRLTSQQLKSDLEGRIQQQAALVRDTGDELKRARSAGAPLDADGRARVKLLQQQLHDQQQTLQVLRDQRQALAAQNGAASVDLMSQVDAQRAQLRLSREQLEGRIRDQKAAVADLQRQVDDAKKALAGEKQDYSRLQSDYQAQRDKVASLRTQLGDEERRLKDLQGTPSASPSP